MYTNPINPTTNLTHALKCNENKTGTIMKIIKNSENLYLTEVIPYKFIAVVCFTWTTSLPILNSREGPVVQYTDLTGACVCIPNR